MKPPHVSQVYDVLYTLGGELTRERIQAIIDNYSWADLPEEMQEPTQIRSIVFDGGPLGAWANCDVCGEWQWLYIAAGDEVNRAMIAQLASQGER